MQAILNDLYLHKTIPFFMNADPEGWDGEGGRRGVQHGEHM